MGQAHSELDPEGDLPAAQKLEGMLMKQSETLKQFNPRFTVLSNRVLSYWDTRELFTAGQPPRGKCDMANCRVFVADAVSDPDLHMCFVVETPQEQRRLAAQRSQTRLHFQAATEADLALWVRKLRVAAREQWAAEATGVRRWGGLCRACARATEGACVRLWGKGVWVGVRRRCRSVAAGCLRPCFICLCCIVLHPFPGH